MKKMNYNKALPCLFQKIYTVLRCRLIFDSKNRCCCEVSSAKGVPLKLVVLNTRTWAGISLLPQYSIEFLLLTVK